MLRASILILLSFILPAVVLAQGPVLYFEKLTTQNDLSHNKVNCILQDKRGFIWIGTDDGLNRFDGHNFAIFRNRPGDNTSISGNIITDIIEDENEILWIATADGGLSRYDYKERSSLQFRQYKHQPGDSTSMPVNIINSVVIDKQGFLWLATGGYSVIRFNRKQEKFDKQIPFSAKRTILDLCIDTDGWLWAGRQGGGLLKINTSTFEAVSDKRYEDLYARLPHVVVSSLFCDANKNTWFGSWDKVLYQYNYREKREVIFQQSTSPGSIVNDEITSFSEDKKGYIWMGGKKEGLQLWDKTNKQFYNYRHNPLQDGSVADNTINCIYIDRSEKVWLGTDKGISVYNPAQQQFVQTFLQPVYKAKAINKVYDFFQTVDKELLIGTNAGLFIYRSEKQQLQHEPLIYKGLSLSATKFFHSTSNNFYLGTDYSLFEYNLQRKSLQLLPNTDQDKVMNKIIESRVVSLIEDTINNNPVLLVSPYGHYMAYYDLKAQRWVSRLDTVKKIISTYNIKDNLIRKFYKSSDGKIWLANTKEGLGEWPHSPGVQINYYANDPKEQLSLSNNSVFDITEDTSKNLWISTYGGGLNYFNRKENKIIHIAGSSNLLEGIATDKRGNVWMISNGNLLQYDIKDKSFSSFILPDLEKTGGVSGYLYKSPEGKMYAGGKNYFIGFYPDSLALVPFEPEPYLTDFRIFNTSFSHLLFEKTIQLRYKQNYFTIEFAAPDFSFEQPVQYAYMLEGHDKDWVECGTRNFAPYSNLKEGTYMFRVKATTKAGTWSAKEQSIEIIITPPLWRRWWFYLLCGLIITGTIYALYRYRINEVLKREAIRNKIARDLHDSVGSTLSSISVFSKVAELQSEQNHKEELNEVLGRISSISNNMITEMNDIVWAINPGNDSMEKIVQRMESFAKPLLATRNISFEFKYDPQIFSLRLSMEMRKNFYLIFKEAITNVIKYSGASVLEAGISLHNKQLELIVKDNGVGFNPEKELSGHNLSLSGNGLKNMKARAGEMQAELAIESNPGNGTVVKLVCPSPH